jgi:hypothetical protein
MNAQPHLSNEDLLQTLYGVSGVDAQAHLRNCADCAQRLSLFEQKRAASAVEQDVSSDFFAVQRRTIYSQLAHPPRKRLLWAPALAATCALAVGVFLYRPTAPVSPPAPVAAIGESGESADAQLFSELYSMDQSLEPSAAAPIRSLFEEQE